MKATPPFAEFLFVSTPWAIDDICCFSRFLFLRHDFRHYHAFISAIFDFHFAGVLQDMPIFLHIAIYFTEFPLCFSSFCFSTFSLPYVFSRCFPFFLSFASLYITSCYDTEETIAASRYRHTLIAAVFDGAPRFISSFSIDDIFHAYVL